MTVLAWMRNELLYINRTTDWLITTYLTFQKSQEAVQLLAASDNNTSQT